MAYHLDTHQGTAVVDGDHAYRTLDNAVAAASIAACRADGSQALVAIIHVSSGMWSHLCWVERDGEHVYLKMQGGHRLTLPVTVAKSVPPARRRRAAA